MTLAAREAALGNLGTQPQEASSPREVPVSITKCH